jgi:alkylation response protein AidB-like acyl-CoA dehydrogenase
MDERQVLGNVREVADDFARQRKERQGRRHLERADFDRLAEAGFLHTGVSKRHGGLWKGMRESTRPVCEMLRALAGGDSSVALVATMHPAVLAFWLASPEARPPYAAAWQQQIAELAESALAGAWWGTITSEPGSGGDIAKTKATARRDGRGGHYRISGAKHFGSGSGIASFMITTALPDGEAEPDLFYMDMRGVPWDGSCGLTLLAEWDGQGMAATQSHAMRLEDYPAIRCAWPGHFRALAEAVGPYINCAFTAVILGIVETAVATAQQQLRSRRETLGSYERVEWSRAELEAWLARQAYEGMLRGIEEGRDEAAGALRGKTAVAELAESVLSRISRVLGGGTFSRRSPFAFWYEDVRALGFLRPPWGLAFTKLFEASPVNAD